MSLIAKEGLPEGQEADRSSDFQKIETMRLVDEHLESTKEGPGGSDYLSLNFNGDLEGDLGRSGKGREDSSIALRLTILNWLCRAKWYMLQVTDPLQSDVTRKCIFEIPLIEADKIVVQFKLPVDYPGGHAQLLHRVKGLVDDMQHYGVVQTHVGRKIVQAFASKVNGDCQKRRVNTRWSSKDHQRNTYRSRWLRECPGFTPNFQAGKVFFSFTFGPREEDQVAFEVDQEKPEYQRLSGGSPDEFIRIMGYPLGIWLMLYCSAFDLTVNDPDRKPNFLEGSVNRSKDIFMLGMSRKEDKIDQSRPGEKKAGKYDRHRERRALKRAKEKELKQESRLRRDTNLEDVMSEHPYAQGTLENVKDISEPFTQRDSTIFGTSYHMDDKNDLEIDVDHEAPSFRAAADQEAKDLISPITASHLSPKVSQFQATEDQSRAREKAPDQGSSEANRPRELRAHAALIQEEEHTCTSSAAEKSREAPHSQGGLSKPVTRRVTIPVVPLPFISSKGPSKSEADDEDSLWSVPSEVNFPNLTDECATPKRLSPSPPLPPPQKDLPRRRLLRAPKSNRIPPRLRKEHIDISHLRVVCRMPGCHKECDSWDGAICPGCGPYSAVRYCGKEHLLEDATFHWTECGDYSAGIYYSSDPAKTTARILDHIPPLLPSYHKWDNLARRRQALWYNVCRDEGEYFLFDESSRAHTNETPLIVGSSSVVQKVVKIGDPAEKDRFRRMLATCLFYSLEMQGMVGYLYRMICEALEKQGDWNPEIKSILLRQFNTEMGTGGPRLLPITGGDMRHVCIREWTGNPRESCADPAHANEPVRTLPLKIKKRMPVTPGFMRRCDTLENGFWILRAHRFTHPTVRTISARINGDGFSDVVPFSKRAFRRGDGWHAADSSLKGPRLA